MGQTIQTRYGAIDVTLQDGRTAYVRVGTGDTGDSTPADAVLELPRGINGRGSGHFELVGDYPDGTWVWEPMRHTRYRRSTGGDLPPAAEQTMRETIAHALQALTSEQLADAQAAKNASMMCERLAWMEGLERMRDQVRAQATALELDPDARVVYVKQRLRSGIDQRATAVRKGDGTLLFIDEPRGDRHPPFLAHDGRGLRRFIDESAPWLEDRG